MEQQRDTRDLPLLEELPLLPGQCKALEEAGIRTSQELLRHPLVQEALLRLLGGAGPAADPEVLGLPIARFLRGPGVEALHRSGCRTLGDLLHLDQERMTGLAEVHWQPGSLLQALGVPIAEPQADLPIEAVATSRRGREACQALGVTSAREFLALDRERFLARPGVGLKTYENILEAIRRNLSGSREAAPGGHETPLKALVENRRALRAFRTLGLQTTGDFLRTPRAEFLKLKNFGERTWFEVSARIQAVLGGVPAVPAACPPALLELSLEALSLSRRVREPLRELGVRTVRELFRLPRNLLASRPNFGEASWRELVEALDHAVRIGVDHGGATPSEALAGLSDLTQALLKPVSRARARFILEARIGCDGSRPLTLRELAERLDLSRERVRQLAVEARSEAQRGARACLERLQEEAEAALRQAGGVLASSTLSRIPLARGAGRAGARGRAIRGVLLFFFPGRFRRLTTGALTTARPEEVRRLRGALAALLARRDSCPAGDLLGSALDQVGLDPACFRGLAAHLARFGFGVRCTPSGPGAAVALSRSSGLSERLQGILEAEGRALSLEDLQLLYRCRFGSAGRARLRAALRAGSEFCQVGPRHFDLALRQPIEPQQAECWREQARARLFAARRPLSIEQIGLEANPYLVAGVLKQDPQIRDLGRLLFTHAAAGRERPSWVEALVHGLLESRGEAMEVQELAGASGPEVATLEAFARESRSLARFPDGRIGLVEWHPFGPAARTEALESAVQWLERNHGYGRLSRLLKAIGAGLPPGTGAPELRDALARDGRFECFGREWVALADSGTSDWVRGRVLSALREAEAPLSLEQLLMARPELAEFEDAIEELLRGHLPVSVLPDGCYAVPR